MTCTIRNWGEEFTREEIEEAKSKGGLLSLELELSRKCNLSCIYCYASSGRALDNELTLPEIFDVIEQAKNLGAKKIIVLGGGEPLIYPGLMDVVNFIVEKGLSCDVFTNATHLTEDIARFFYQRRVALAVKFNSLDPDVQDELAGVKGTFERIQQGLNHLFDAGYPNKSHKLGIETVVVRQNLEGIPEIWTWARDRGIVPYVEIMTLQGRARQHPDLEVSPAELKQLFELLSDIDRKRYGLFWEPHPPIAASQCARHEYSCTVVANGDVNPCPGVDITIGNVRDKPLQNILNESEVIYKLRNIRRFIKGKCSRCHLKDGCYGCRGHTYQITGDILAEDPIYVNNITETIRNIYGRNVEVISFLAIAQIASSITNAVNFMTFAASLAAFAVAVAGVAATMITSVIERTREIGVMKALGFTDGQVLILIISEGIVMSLIGAVIGITLGSIGAYALASRGLTISSGFTKIVINAPPDINIYNVSLTALMTVFVGIIGSAFPAYRAAKIPPAMALRYE